MVIPIVGLVGLWQTGWMPPSDVVLLPLCIGLALIGVIVAGVAWRKGSRGRVVQGIGLALAPIALYFTGLLRLIWDAVVALAAGRPRIIFTPSMWFGISLLGLCVVLWVVGGLLDPASGEPSAAPLRRLPRRNQTGRRHRQHDPAKAPPRRQPRRRSHPAAKGKAPAQEVDPEMAEIEAILKNRGIS